MLTNEDIRRIKRLFPFQNDVATVADDGFFTITPELQSGLIFITVVNSAASFQGMFAYDVSGVSCVLGTTAADLEAAIGVLTGTTGTDGKLTVSANTDGKLYIENRSGISKNIHWLTIF